jgi:translocation and assembly module TamB
VNRRTRNALIAATAVLLAAFLFVIVLTQTDFGREIVRRQIVATLQNNSKGVVRVEGIGGNLLRGITLTGVSITDSAGRPLFLADTVQTGYGIRAALGRRIELSNMRIVNPFVMIEKIPGDDLWNYQRIFPRDPDPVPAVRPGWGTWIRFDDITLINGRFIARVPWNPPEDLPPAQREAAITEALGVSERMYIARMGNGFQRVMDFRHINTHMPVVVLADPDREAALVDVTALSTAALPFRQPGLLVRSLTGSFHFTGDSLWWNDARAELADSRVRVSGRYTMERGDLRLRLVGNPISPGDVRWVFPELPETGTGRLEFTMEWAGDSGLYVARNADIRMDGAHIRGHLGITTVRDRLVFQPVTDLRFSSVRVDLLRRLIDLDLPRPGTLTGHARFEGDLEALRVNGDVVYVTPAGRNQFLADGVIGFPGDDFTFRDFRIRMDPITADLARAVIEDIPFDGVFTGLAEINGSTAATVRAVGDVTHVEAGRTSRAIGTVAVRPQPVDTWFDVNARLAPLALGTVGRFAPALQLRGTVTGPFAATGTLDDFRVNTSLAAPAGGNIRIFGRLALGGRQPGYDLTMNALLFNAAAVTGLAPQTSLTAFAHAQGVGVELATMRGTFVADVETSQYDTLALDSARVRMAFADGLARIDTLAIHVPQGIAEAAGTFGLAAHREGELAYRIVIDTLAAFAGFVPGQPGAPRAPPTRPGEPRIGDPIPVGGRPGAPATVAAAAGEPEPSAEPVALPGEVLAGTLFAEGVARGNIHRFGIAGTAWGEDLTVRDNYVQRFTATYDLADIRTPTARFNVEATANTALIGGFEFDTLYARVDHAAGRGEAQLSVRQDDLRVYAMDANYILHADHNELHLNEMTLQFDTAVWRTVRPATVEWGGPGIEINELELSSGEGRRLYVDGRLPTEGPADLHVIAEQFEIGHVFDLLQTPTDARGLISLDVRATGTPADPTLQGTAAIADFVFRETTLPLVSGTFTYDNETIVGRAEATREDGTTLVFAEGAVPINLALTGVTGPRIPLDRQISVQVMADSFPVGIIPGAEGFITEVSGRTVGSARIVGTLRNPVVEGEFSIVDGGARVVPLGIHVGGIYGHIRLTGDTIVIDSIAGSSAGGPLRLAGGIGISNITEPSFDLSFRAWNARVLNNEHGRIHADAQLALYGPFTDAFLSGGVTIRTGVIHMPEPDERNVIGVDDPALWNVVDTAVAADRDLFPAQSPLLANLEVDIGLRVERDVFVRSRDANIEVYTDGDMFIRADRAREILTLEGILLSERGDYVFMQKRFRVRRGSATFVGGTEINPTLQAVAEYEVRLPAREAIMIQVVVSGTLRSPRLELRSTAQPPLSQSDLLSYLAFGRPSASLTQLEGTSLTGGGAGGNLLGQGAALAVRQLATVALGQVTDELAGEAARALGADVFIITPADVQTDVGNFLRTTEIEFGRYVRPATFVALQIRPDPEALRRPGFQVEHRFHRLEGYQFRLSMEPRYILQEPTLGDREPRTRSVFGAFLIREWRY